MEMFDGKNHSEKFPNLFLRIFSQMSQKFADTDSARVSEMSYRPRSMSGNAKIVTVNKEFFVNIGIRTFSAFLIHRLIILMNNLIQNSINTRTEADGKYDGSFFNWSLQDSAYFI